MNVLQTAQEKHDQLERIYAAQRQLAKLTISSTEEQIALIKDWIASRIYVDTGMPVYLRQSYAIDLIREQYFETIDDWLRVNGYVMTVYFDTRRHHNDTIMIDYESPILRCEI